MKRQKQRLRSSLDVVALLGGAAVFLGFLIMMAVR